MDIYFTLLAYFILVEILCVVSSLEEFHETYLRIREGTPPPIVTGNQGPSTSAVKLDPGDEDEGDSDHDPQPKRYHLVVKREEY